MADLGRCEFTTIRGHQCTRRGENDGFSGKRACWQHAGSILLDDFVERFMRPAMLALADDISNKMRD